MTRSPARAAALERVHREVRARYGSIASGPTCCASAGASGTGSTPLSGGCCGGSSSGPSAPGGCCAGPAVGSGGGYGPDELAALPPGADLGLGCGNPTGFLDLRPGETVVDLGSGAGVDCFLAARKVGPTGHVIGVDMTPEMLEQARNHAREGGYAQVEFRLGEIEHLPVADGSIDVVLSNCVINLAPDQEAVYREAFRVLRPGGRLAIADVVAARRISKAERDDPALWSSCASGAASPGRVRSLLRRTGFVDVQVGLPTTSRRPAAGRGPLVQSASIRAAKPRA